jgi:hypothetical protein
MQMDSAQKLRDGWEKSGNRPCEHKKVEKEYYLGSDTGDKVCTTCGKTM